MYIDKFYYIYTKIKSTIYKRLSLSCYKNKIYPGFWIASDPKKQIYSDCFVFDFSDSNFVHIGDQLFFIYTILTISKEKKVYVLGDNFCTSLWAYLGVFINKAEIDFPYTLVAPAYMYCTKGDYDLAKSPLCKTLILYDFNDFNILIPLGEQILLFFLFICRKNEKNVCEYEFKLPVQSKDYHPKSKFIIFNETINSGFFRKLFLVTDSFTKMLKIYHSKGYKVVLVGAINDYISNDRREFIDYDLRGRLTLLEIFSLFESEDCVSYLGYDNAFMHIACYLRKDSFILFRGRFSSKGRDLHYRSINVALCNNEGKHIRYLGCEKLNLFNKFHCK
jgi:hypothetical protein